ncbi:MAG: hypothetical protein ACRC33_03025 [Gemmataceae bacterium]
MTTVRLIAAAVLVAACPAGRAGEAAFRHYPGPWEGLFRVVSVRHDADRNEIVWELKALADADVPACHASLATGDAVEVGKVPVRFPGGTKVKADARVRAVAPLGAFDIADVAKVRIGRGS